jgi:hypothetical protein
MISIVGAPDKHQRSFALAHHLMVGHAQGGRRATLDRGNPFAHL